MSAREPRRVLIATYGATSRSGSDLYTRDLALALLRRGWLPIVYATYLGPIAEELRQATIPVTDDITAIGVRPDIIHGHHHLETLAAVARFPAVPALFVSHDALAWHSTPPRTPRIGAYIAVDRNCRDRMMMEHGIPDVAIRVMPNAVDLERFPRRPSLPSKPRRAAIFSNQASSKTFAAPIEAACARFEIEIDIIGMAAGTATDHPEQVLAGYDIVFGKARCALEAAATGAAVVVCDADGLAGMVTSRDLDAIRQLNFGKRLLQRPITETAIAAEIERYDPIDAAGVTDSIRASGGTDRLAEQFIEIYEALCLDPVLLTDEEERRGLADSLSHLSKHIQISRPGQQTVMRAILSSSTLRTPVQFLRRMKKRMRP